MTCQCRGRIRNRYRLADEEHHARYFCWATNTPAPSLWQRLRWALRRMMR